MRPVVASVLIAVACTRQDPAALSHARMVEELAAVGVASARDNPYFGTAKAAALRAELAAGGAAAPWRLRLDTGIAELRLGNERRGLEILTELCDGLREGRIAGDFVANLAANFYLGVGYLRLGETANCCRRPGAESCILPLAEPAQHSDREGSENAIRYLLVVLANTAPDDRWHLSARWLLNLAHMTLGSYPDGVPAEHRLEPALFATGTGPRFANVAQRLGLDAFSNAGGVIVDDFDGDSRLDLVVSDWRPEAPLRLYRNDGAGRFEERAAAAGLEGLTGGLNLLQADYDNDGDLDFVVLRGAWWYENGRHPNSLVRNNGDGTFTDVTFLAGLDAPRCPTQAAGWADYDNDGDLDLYVGNEHSARAPSRSQLFRNNGDGTFTDVASAAGVTNDRYCKAVSWGDVDGDRDPDLYVSNADGDNRLYLNRGDGTFVDVAGERGVVDPQQGFPAFFFDVDNDGDLDLFAANYGTSIGHIVAHLIGVELAGSGRPRLYLNDGAGRFREAGVEFGLTYPSLPMGANFGDLDNDGWLDLYLGTGDPEYESLMPNLAYRNVGGARFEDVTMATGLGHLQKGHGIAFADIDDDGDLDIFAEMGGAYPGDAFGNALFENPGHGNRWLTLHLIGTASNRSAIGARIRVVVEQDGRERSIYRWVNSGGSFGASPLRQTIGLGRPDRIDRVEILWPTTGRTQTVTDLALDATLTVTET
ncbi:MAG: CRTAC1 family protein [Planctomycetes bacterium]|nr:CRTAC1 family protein [Planctomycetota bacterium]